MDISELKDLMFFSSKYDLIVSQVVEEGKEVLSPTGNLILVVNSYSSFLSSIIVTGMYKCFFRDSRVIWCHESFQWWSTCRNMTLG